MVHADGFQNRVTSNCSLPSCAAWNVFIKKKENNHLFALVASSLDIKSIKLPESTWLSEVNYHFFPKSKKFDLDLSDNRLDCG